MSNVYNGLYLPPDPAELNWLMDGPELIKLNPIWVGNGSRGPLRHPQIIFENYEA